MSLLETCRQIKRNYRSVQQIMNRNIKNTLLSVTAAAGLFVAGSVAANADTVTVKAGDTVSDIAAKNHTTIAAIEKANKLADVNFILPGQKLDINGDGNVKVIEQPQQAQAPVQQTQQTVPAQVSAPKQQDQVQPKAQTTAPVQGTAAQPQQQKTVVQSNNNSGSLLSGSEAAARQFIILKESGGNYSAKNGIYIGAYQLSADKLGGDYSKANQDRVANEYVQARYGSWVNAQKYWNQHHSY